MKLYALNWESVGGAVHVKGEQRTREGRRKHTVMNGVEREQWLVGVCAREGVTWDHSCSMAQEH